MADRLPKIKQLKVREAPKQEILPRARIKHIKQATQAASTQVTCEKQEQQNKARDAKVHADHTTSRLNKLRANAANVVPKDKIQRERQRRASVTHGGRTRHKIAASSHELVHEETMTIGEASHDSLRHSRADLRPPMKTIPDGMSTHTARVSGHAVRSQHGQGYHMERKQAAAVTGNKLHRKRLGKVSRVSPKTLWKRVVRKIINENLHKGLDGVGAIGSKKNAQGKDTMFFDKNVFKVNSNRGLTSIEKRILQKPSNDRTDEDLVTLKGVVDKLRCFDKYTRVVKRDLSRVIYYMPLNAGRYIIKQGHDGFSFYFIVHGRVQVRITDINKDTGEKFEFAVGEMAEGTSFGELALLHDIKRTASIVCIANGSEFLRVERHDFETVLRMSTEKEWADRLNVLNWQPSFRDFSTEERGDLNQHSKIQEYLPGKLIIGDTTTPQDTLYFVASGVCSITRSLTIVKEKVQYGGEKLHLLEDMTAADRLMFPTGNLARRRLAASRFLKPEKQLWSVGEVGKGFYFGVGEDLSHTYVTAKNKVEILEVRRIKFIKNGRWKLVEKMKDEFDRALPSNRKLFNKYMKDSRWDHYKQKLVRDVTCERHVENHTLWEDVPLALRYNSIRGGSLQNSLHIKF